MSWITLSKDDLQNGYISGAEYDALTQAALAAGQDGDEVVASAIADTVQMVRGYVANKYNLGEGETVPHELKSAALVIVRNGVFTRLPAMQALNDETRREEYRNALSLLKDVSRGTFKIEQAAAISDQVMAGPQVEVLVSPPRTATREKTAGLL